MPARQPSSNTHQSTTRPTSQSAAHRPAKSAKRDGTLKARWNAEQRTERGRPPRRSSGRDFEATARTTGRQDRDQRPDRGQRSEWTPRSDSKPRSDWQPRSDSKPRSDWQPRSDSKPRSDWQPRADWKGSPERAPRADRPYQSGKPRTERSYNSARPRTDRAEYSPAPVIVPAQPLKSVRSFGDLGLPSTLVTELAGRGITEAFPIQAATIPDALRGRDVLGRARTGSGKTLAFALPILARLTGRTDSHVGAMILVPTRELAMQATDAIAPLARLVGLSTVLVAGGMPYAPQLRAFERGVDIVVATPGRLIDLLERGAADLSRVEVAVLDEADHMADLGFTPEVRALLDAIPAGGQRLLFSATLDRAVDALVRDYLSEPVIHEVDSGQASVDTMEHHLLHVAPKDKAGVTAELASREGRTVVFARSQLGVERTAEELRAAGVLAGALHGGLGQGQRNRVLAAFKTGQLPVLVATDVAARGLHVDDVSLVVQADPPNGPKEYLHRAGRTARAGADGVVVTLVLPHQRRDVTRLAAAAGVASELVRTEPGDRTLALATGARTPSGEPVSTAAYERLIAPPVRTDRGRGRPRRSGGWDKSGPRNRRDR